MVSGPSPAALAARSVIQAPWLQFDSMATIAPIESSQLVASTQDAIASLRVAFMQGHHRAFLSLRLPVETMQGVVFGKNISGKSRNHM